MTLRRLATLGAPLLLAVACAPDAGPMSATELEGRLIAPCCWTQTLDVHESDVAQALRNEIAQRLARGESAVAIEDDLVARFGEPMRAVPRGRDPRRIVPLVVGAAMVIAALALARLLRRWTARADAEPIVAPRARDAYDDRVDDELAQREDVP